MLDFRKFKDTDVEIFSPLIKAAFNADAQMHIGHDDGPTGYDNGDYLRKWYLSPKASAFAIFMNQKPIGAVTAFINQEKQEGYLGNIFVNPALENQGYGLQIWRFIERNFPEVKLWRTDTLSFSRRNHVFYVNKCGFKIYEIENPKAAFTTYKLEKIMGEKASRI